jgi:hypothetical protein
VNNPAENPVDARIIYIAECRLHNRRVIVGRYSNGDYLIHYRKYTGWRNIKETRLRMSEGAALATAKGLWHVMEKTMDDNEDAP